ILIAYFLAIACLIILIDLTDVQYFEEAGKHLTYEATQYLNSSAAPILMGAFQLHPALSTLSLVGCIAFIAIASLVFKRLLQMSFHHEDQRLPAIALLSLPIWIVLGILAVRGG